MISRHPQRAARASGATEAPLLAGRYRLGRRLGRGSSAVVYAATDTLLERAVTVKVFDVVLASDPAWLDRFRQQVAKAAGLTHPHIAKVLDAGLDDASGGQPFVVTQPAGDLSLRAVLDRQRGLDAPTAAGLALQVASALEYAHERGVVHADLKPENVVVDVDLRFAAVVDFSLSFVSALTGAITPETLVRRAAYLAPEQVRGESVSPRTDVYALGVLLYEMVVGRPPFVGPTPEATAERRVHEHPQPASNYDPSLSPQLEAVISRALWRAPEQRWPSAGSFREALAGLDATRLRPVPLPAPATLVRAPRTTLAERSGWSLNIPPRVPIVGGLVILLLALALLVPQMLNSGPHLSSLSLLSPATTEIPDLVGLPLGDAQMLVRSRGLQLEVLGERVSDTYAKGSIIQQTPVAGFQQMPNAPMRVTVSAGPSAPSALLPSPEQSASGAAPAMCAPGSKPVFVLGFADLKQRVGAPMGDPLECEHVDPASGDIVQKTSSGLAFYRRATNTPAFTDGWQHWAIVGDNVVEWTGDSADPPGR